MGRGRSIPICGDTDTGHRTSEAVRFVASHQRATALPRAYHADRGAAAQHTPTGVEPPTGGVSSVGWLFGPQGITAVLLRVRDEYTRIPLYITETGWTWSDYVDPAGDVKDPERIAFLVGYLRAAHAAIAQGVDLRGLIVWCFQDNFASSMGYAKRFGLVWTDFATQRQIPKQSARWDRDVIVANGLSATSA